MRDRDVSSRSVPVLAFKVVSLAERYSPKPFKVFVIVFKIISVAVCPTPSCFQVISLVGLSPASYFVTVSVFNIISVADHLLPSCYFFELISWLIATLRVVLNFCRMVENCFVEV